MLSARIIGIPGSGKTTRAMEILAKIRDIGYGWNQIGFVSFTRAARREASKRAAEVFGVSLQDLEKEGWFRTLHGAAMRIIGARKGELVNGDHDFLRSVLNEDVEAVDQEEDELANQFRGRSPATIALTLWDVCRNRLVPFDNVYREAMEMTLGRVPIDIGRSRTVIRKYEEAKRAAGRFDFTDFLLRFCGKRISVDHGISEVDPEGEVPRIPVWLHDECQDSSPLLDASFTRLLGDHCVYLYVLGQPEQAIYSWAGADPMMFMGREVQKEDYLLKTWRCYRRIIDLGTRLINRGSTFRHLTELMIDAAHEGGEIDDNLSEYDWTRRLDPTVSTLVMARTNEVAGRLGDQLTAKGIPWRSNKSGARWPKITAATLIDAFSSLERGEVIDGRAWARIVAAVPAELLTRGTKTRFNGPNAKEEREAADFVSPFSIVSDYGATETLAQQIASGQWREYAGNEAMEVIKAREQYGELTDNPAVIVSTVHGTKGMEAERVFLHTGITPAVERAINNPEGLVQERRVWYVGATRAKSYLGLIRAPKANYEEIYEVM